MRTKDSQNMVANTVKTFISIVSVMVIFGLSWIFGALSIDRAAVVFQWFFVIFCTSQGFVLFIFFCVIGKDACEEWRNLLTSNIFYHGKKKGGSTSSGIKISRSYGTKDTPLPSKNYSERSWSSPWMQKKGVLSFNSNTDGLEMDVLAKEPDDDKKKSFRISRHSKRSRADTMNKEEDSQVPPQILFRLKRPYYDLVMEEMSRSPSPSVSPPQTTGGDIDYYEKLIEGYDPCDTDSEFDYTEL